MKISQINATSKFPLNQHTQYNKRILFEYNIKISIIFIQMTDNKQSNAQKWVDFSSGSDNQSSDSENNDRRNTAQQQQFNKRNQLPRQKPQYTQERKYTQDKQREYQQPQFKSKQSATSTASLGLEQLPIEHLEKIEGDEVWLLVIITAKSREDQADLRNRIFNLKNPDKNIRVYHTQKKDRTDKNDRSGPCALDVCLSKAMAEDFMKNGLDNETGYRFAVHPRNFYEKTHRNYDDNDRRDGQRRPRGDRKGGRGRGGYRDRNFDEQGDNKEHGGRNDRRGQRGERGQRGQRGQRGDRKKPVYVDKETGQKSDNKKLFDQRQAQQSNRQYSKKRTQQIGNQLGSFRNNKKSKAEEVVQIPEQQGIIQVKEVQVQKVDTKNQKTYLNNQKKAQNYTYTKKSGNDKWKRKQDNKPEQIEVIDLQKTTYKIYEDLDSPTQKIQEKAEKAEKEENVEKEDSKPSIKKQQKKDKPIYQNNDNNHKGKRDYRKNDNNKESRNNDFDGQKEYHKNNDTHKEYRKNTDTNDKKNYENNDKKNYDTNDRKNYENNDKKNYENNDRKNYENNNDRKKKYVAKGSDDKQKKKTIFKDQNTFSDLMSDD